MPGSLPAAVGLTRLGDAPDGGWDAGYRLSVHEDVQEEKVGMTASRSSNRPLMITGFVVLLLLVLAVLWLVGVVLS